MTNITLEGHLGNLIGRIWKLKVRTFRELFCALDINSNGLFRRCMMSKKKEQFAVFCNGEIVDPSFFLDQNIKNKNILIIPIISGNATALTNLIITGSSQAVSAATAATLTYKITFFVVNTIISAAISFGITFLMSKLLNADDPEQVNTSSFIFSSPDNVSEQGNPVPIGYGRMRVGSRVISASLSSLDRGKFENLNNNDLFSSITSDPSFSSEQVKFGAFST